MLNEQNTFLVYRIQQIENFLIRFLNVQALKSSTLMFTWNNYWEN